MYLCVFMLGCLAPRHLQEAREMTNNKHIFLEIDFLRAVPGPPAIYPWCTNIYVESVQFYYVPSAYVNVARLGGIFSKVGYDITKQNKCDMYTYKIFKKYKTDSFMFENNSRSRFDITWSPKFFKI